MGSHISKHKPGGGGGTQATTHLSEMDRQRELLHKVALQECQSLSRAHNIDQVNLFFVPVPGVDFPEFTQRFAAITQFPVVEAATEDQELFASVDRLERAWRPETWDYPTSAAKDLWARQVQNMVITLPRPETRLSLHHRAHGWPNVRIYTRSPVEDMFINFPLHLEGHADAGLTDLVRATTNLAWKMLQCQCNLGSSVWIYLKMNEEWWSRLHDSHRRAGSADETTLQRWATYRKALNDFFTSSDFQKHHHTLTIEVHNDMLATDDVVHEVASIVAKFVGQQVAARMWDRDTTSDEFRTYITSAAYRQGNIVHARQTETMRTQLALSDEPPRPVRPAVTTLELSAHPSSTSVSSELGRSSSRSSRGSLRRVHSGNARLQ